MLGVKIGRGVEAIKSALMNALKVVMLWKIYAKKGKIKTAFHFKMAIYRVFLAN